MLQITLAHRLAPQETTCVRNMYLQSNTYHNATSECYVDAFYLTPRGNMRNSVWRLTYMTHLLGGYHAEIYI